jgi:acyl-CoA reductase-like NAD-dependent aldehyde dehydrogenase
MQLDNPYTGEIIEEVPFITLYEQKTLLDRSRQAYRNIRSATITERLAITGRLRDYFRDNKELVATDITRMMGKPIV